MTGKASGGDGSGSRGEMQTLNGDTLRPFLSGP